jgi:hypothetical protein
VVFSQGLVSVVSQDVVTAQINLPWLDFTPYGWWPLQSPRHAFYPVLQRADGSFIGIDNWGRTIDWPRLNGGWSGTTNNLLALGPDGTQLWTQQVSATPAAITPLYATSASSDPLCWTYPQALGCNTVDGGVVVTSSWNSTLGTLYNLDQNGNLISQTADTGAVMSWTGGWYVPTSEQASNSIGGTPQAAVDTTVTETGTDISMINVLLMPASSFLGVIGGNYSNTGVAIPALGTQIDVLSRFRSSQCTVDVIRDLPSDAQSCSTSTSALSFYAPPGYDLYKVVAAGKAGGKFNLFAAWAAVGFCGTYDYQRSSDGAGKLIFYRGYQPVSNVNVGAYLYGTGWSRQTANIIAETAASLESSNVGDPSKALYTNLGYDMAAAGVSPTCH